MAVHAAVMGLQSTLKGTAPTFVEHSTYLGPMILDNMPGCMLLGLAMPLKTMMMGYEHAAFQCSVRVSGDFF